MKLSVRVIVLLAVFGAAVILGVVRARPFAKPITELTKAGKRLATGDFDSRVDIRTGDELQQLGEVFNETGPKLREREKIKRSLELARQIQQNLLPKESPKLERFELAGRCKYCDETGGDYYDFITLTKPGKIGVALGDVTGHGIGAALLMATARSILRSGAAGHESDLSGLFGVLNSHLARDTDDDKFITLFYAVLDEADQSVIWASGGHDPAFWYHRSSGKIEELPNTGLPVGLMEDASFEQAGPIYVKEGDIVVVGTDGIWEAQNISGEIFSREKFLKVIRRASSQKAEDICIGVIEAVTHFLWLGCSNR